MCLDNGLNRDQGFKTRYSKPAASPCKAGQRDARPTASPEVSPRHLGHLSMLTRSPLNNGSRSSRSILTCPGVWATSMSVATSCGVNIGKFVAQAGAATLSDGVRAQGRAEPPHRGQCGTADCRRLNEKICPDAGRLQAQLQAELRGNGRSNEQHHWRNRRKHDKCHQGGRRKPGNTVGRRTDRRDGIHGEASQKVNRPTALESR